MGNRIAAPALTARAKKWVAVKVWSPDSQYDQQYPTIKATPPAILSSMPPRLSLPLKGDLPIASIWVQRSIELRAIDAKEGCVEVLQSMDLDATPQKDVWDMYDQVAFRKAGVFVLRLTGEKEPPFTAGKSIMYEIQTSIPTDASVRVNQDK